MTRADELINLDFTRRLLVHLDDLDWSPSPSPGVDRLRLEREEAERGRATSVVRYARGSAFPPHVHTGGEEFLVLAGVFSDDAGDYPAGTYVRNPIGSKHAPRSDDGCTIFVKLCQMTTVEPLQTVARIDTDDREQVLYRDGDELVRAVRLEHGEVVEIDGTEVLVVEGAVNVQSELLPAWSWLRFPRGDSVRLEARAPTTLWTKSGHLP